MVGRLQVSNANRPGSSGTSGPRATNRQARSSSRRRSRSRSRARSSNIPAGYGGGPVSSRVNLASEGALNQTRIRARELVATIVVEAGKNQFGNLVTVGPNPTKNALNAPPQLAQMAKLFEQYSVEQWVVEWEPMVGTTTSGAVSMCVVPADNRKDPEALLDAGFIAATQPNVSSRVYAPCKLACPQAYLHAKKWWPISDVTDVQTDFGVIPAACYILVETSAPKDAGITVGRVWVNYTVHYQGFSKNK